MTALPVAGAVGGTGGWELLQLPDGTALPVRAVHAFSDLPELRELAAGCSDIDRIRRCGTVDIARAVGWLLPHRISDIALLAATPGGQIAGVVNIARVDAMTGEVALLVAPGWRRRGVAAGLLRAAAARAPHRIIAVIEPDNRAALGLAASLQARRAVADTTEWEIAARCVAAPPPT